LVVPLDKRPDAVIEFDPADGSGGTNLVEDPTPEQALVSHMRKRLNVLSTPTFDTRSDSDLMPTSAGNAQQAA
jgi:hypothetical protein